MSNGTNQTLDQAVAKFGSLLQVLKGHSTITAEHLAVLAEGLALVAKGMQQMDQVAKQVAADIQSIKQAPALQTAQKH